MNKPDQFLLFALMALWGLNFSVIKLGVNNIDSLLLTALRFTFAVIPCIFFINRPNVAWRYLMAYGVSFGVGVWGLTTLAINTGTSSGITSLLLNMSLVSSLAISYYWLHEKISRRQLLGAASALLGLMLILSQHGGAVTIEGVTLMLIASVCWSLNSYIVKRANTTKIFAFNVWAMAFAPIPLLLLAVLSNGMSVISDLEQQVNASVIFSVLFQAYPTTLLGYWLWNKMIVKHSLAEVAPMTLFVPIFALLGGMVFYQEAISSIQLMAGGFILLGHLISQGHVTIASKYRRIKSPRAKD